MVSYIGNNIKPKGVGLIPPKKVIDGGYRTIIGNGSGLFSNPFTIEWTVAGDAAARTVTLPLVAGYSYNFVANWGDGTSSTVTAYNDANRIHTFPSDGVYITKIYGVMEGWSFNSGGSRLKITRIIHWGNSPVFSGFKYLSSGFYGCTNLVGPLPFSESIPISGTGPTNLDRLFRNCTSLDGDIPPYLLYKTTSVTSAYQFFRDCTGLTSNIPGDFLSKLTLVTDLSGFFKDSSVTGNIPVDLLRYVISVTNLSNFLDGCIGLTGGIPADLLKYVVNVTTLSTFLNGCTGLTGGIPSTLLNYTTSNTSLYSFIASCSGLTGSIPSGLLDNQTNVTDMGHFMDGCSGITGSLPSGLLDYLTNLTNLSNAFGSCSGLTNDIPTGFLDNLTIVTDMRHVFRGCTNLTGYGANLCKYNTVCTNFGFFMVNCDKMQHRSDVFCASGDEDTRFLNQSINFTSCFERENWTGTQGTAPDLWNYDFGTGTPTKTDCWAGAGNSTTSLTNYSSIPAEWK